MTRSPDLVDQILALDPGHRDIAAFAKPGAALEAARALRGARRVLIVTGFTVEPDMPETDGPPGAAVLGRALRRLGARVTYVTDATNVSIVEAVLKTLDEPSDVLVYSGEPDAAYRLLASEQPTHLVAIERPGRNRAGDYLNMRGDSVAEWNAPIDELFLCSGDREAGLDRGWAEKGATRLRSRGQPTRRVPWLGGVARPVTVGIGDGGNEIGMGSVRARIARLDALRARIATVVPVDHLVVAGVSNWGGYGIVAALARLTGSDLLHTPDIERRLITACVAVGACDGVTRRREPTVDGLAADTHAAVVDLLRLAARSRVTRAGRMLNR
ncbi:MAG: hypothetical protein DME00_07380 [Candidatus Rokuibacteriota bacterium]|nr:MAG: hypothetical protein DME00_07380 [Candidatus Rokubacteria bacterium]